LDFGISVMIMVSIRHRIFALKQKCFLNNFSTPEIKQWINELINNELVREYTIDTKAYWIVTGWKKHQRIDKPTPRHPLPQSDLKKIEDNSTIIRGDLAEQSWIAR
ncbi:MAG: hypothetical protein NTZ86_08560, partial [Legionellales bacterium]|nr:hypothetical protein [Legionellales bacterium]